MTERKKVDYALISAQIRSLAEEARGWVPVMANAAALIYEAMPELNWAGFYIAEGEELILGPFQGKAACVRIRKGRGVCGAAFEKDTAQVVPNVHLFPGHIACDSASRSEIVLPLHRGCAVAAVLDIDSPVEGRFAGAELEGLSLVAKTLESVIEW